jgi:hypothetical protein
VGTRQVGRPRQRWQYLKKLKVKNWEETAKDGTWRGLAEKANTHKGLYCQMMIMITRGDINIITVKNTNAA